MLVKNGALAPKLVTVASMVSALAIAGCEGMINGNGGIGPGLSQSTSTNGSPGAGATTGASAASGAGAVTGPNATGAGASSAGTTTVTSPVNTPYTRLTRAEYAATVKAAFNVTADVSGIPDDGRVGLFTSNVLALDPAAEEILASEDLAAQIVPSVLPACTGTAATCISTSYQAPLERLFRRPLTAAEVTRFGTLITSLVGSGVSAEAATRGMLVSALMSSDFLFRSTSVSGATARGRRFAEHLSYALVDAPPDAQLTTAGQSDPAVLGANLKEQVVRLSADARAVPVLARFLAQWLFVDVDLKLESADFATSPLYAELLAFAKNALTTSAPVKSFVNSAQGFVQNNDFAAYGLAAQSSTQDVATVSWASSSRRGILGEELFMDATRHPDAGRRPIFRGHVVRTGLLCQAIPSPPANVVDLNSEVSDRTTDTRCASCHSLMDPIGKAFAPFDLDNTAGAPAPVVNGPGEISGTFKDLAALLDAIAGSQAYADCFARNLLAFFLEQTPDSIDSGAISDVASVVKSGGSLADALSQAVVSLDQRSLDAIPWCTGQ